jgi:hypothetical protein
MLNGHLAAFADSFAQIFAAFHRLVSLLDRMLRSIRGLDYHRFGIFVDGLYRALHYVKDVFLGGNSCPRAGVWKNHKDGLHRYSNL